MSTVSAKVTFVDGLQFVGETGSGHAVVMDGVEKFGGRDSGPRPMEMLLLGLGGCTGMDVVSILRKKKQALTGLEIRVEGGKAEEHPQGFEQIRLVYAVRGRGVEEAAVKRAIELSMEKYCSVKATLEGTARIEFSYTIEEA
jgi:putative redox protein